MKRIMLELTPALAKSIDEACQGKSRNAAIEDWLWRIADIRRAADRLDLDRQPRRQRGRPKNVD